MQMFPDFRANQHSELNVVACLFFTRLMLQSLHTVYGFFRAQDNNIAKDRIICRLTRPRQAAAVDIYCTCNALSTSAVSTAAFITPLGKTEP